MRILIVEDEKILAGQLAEQLRLSGFVTDLCHDGNEAGFLGETEPYDAIILDLGLPGRDGLSVLKEWRSKGIDTPVLVLTARGQLHEKIEGLNAGADDYLTKPFQVAELVARVQALVRRAAGNASSILEIGGVRLDMAASPYDCAALGLEPVKVETPEGRAAYVRAQREFAEESTALRARLLAVTTLLTAEDSPTLTVNSRATAPSAGPTPPTPIG